MAKNKYDIFISYRRDGGAQYARILQLELEKRGYKVFLDYEELTDGVFGDNIKEAIREAPVFMMVLSAHYLDRCRNEGDWVREEIMLAVKQGKHFIPINPDSSFDGIPADIPEEIKQAVGSNQHSEVNFGQLLGASVDRMVKNRVSLHIARRKHGKGKWITMIAVVCLLLICGAIAVSQIKKKSFEEQAELKSLAEEYAKPIEEICKQNINWSNDVTTDQLKAVCSILYNMVEVKGGQFMQGAAPDASGSYDEMVCKELEVPQNSQTVASFFTGKYEVTTAQWYLIMGGTFEEADSLLPISNVTFEECKAFVNKLSDITGLNFRLPTETEWEFAARGGIEEDSTTFAGSNNADEVAWYSKNSGGKPYVCDATNSPKYPNGLDLYDMSGNLSEWCDTPFRPYNKEVVVPDTTSVIVRGGNFESNIYELTVFHREPMNPQEKDKTVGFRIVIANDIK